MTSASTLQSRALDVIELMHVPIQNDVWGLAEVFPLHQDKILSVVKSHPVFRIRYAGDRKSIVLQPECNAHYLNRPVSDMNGFIEAWQKTESLEAGSIYYSSGQIILRVNHAFCDGYQMQQYFKPYNGRNELPRSQQSYIQHLMAKYATAIDTTQPSIYVERKIQNEMHHRSVKVEVETDNFHSLTQKLILAIAIHTKVQDDYAITTTSNLRRKFGEQGKEYYTSYSADFVTSGKLADLSVSLEDCYKEISNTMAEKQEKGYMFGTLNMIVEILQKGSFPMPPPFPDDERPGPIFLSNVGKIDDIAGVENMDIFINSVLADNYAAPFFVISWSYKGKLFISLNYSTQEMTEHDARQHISHIAFLVEQVQSCKTLKELMTRSGSLAEPE